MRPLLLVLAIFAIYLGVTGTWKPFIEALTGAELWSGGGDGGGGGGGGGSSGFG